MPQLLPFPKLHIFLCSPSHHVPVVTNGEERLSYETTLPYFVVYNENVARRLSNREHFTGCASIACI